MEYNYELPLARLLTAVRLELDEWLPDLHFLILSLVEGRIEGIRFLINSIALLVITYYLII